MSCNKSTVLNNIYNLQIRLEQFTCQTEKLTKYQLVKIKYS